MRIIGIILLNGLLVYLASVLTNGVSVESYWTAVIAGILLGFANSFIKPILTVLTLPITILTLGLFLLVINAAMVLLVDTLMPGFDVAGWSWAIIFSLVFAILNFFFGGFDLAKA